MKKDELFLKRVGTELLSELDKISKTWKKVSREIRKFCRFLEGKD